MRDFKHLRIWKKGLEISIRSYQLVESFPAQERYGLSAQITRASVSIPSNIAEGSSRRSERDYSRFLEIALGSSFELETQVWIADALNFGSMESRRTLIILIQDLQKMISGFLSKLSH